ncbi:MAG TPA: PTS sugar transporter subunit IIA [Gammaproteobacteria bacterium]|nr:PTS sugar transporter subunit IIA [Gammaproteobacteria bacterium]
MSTSELLNPERIACQQDSSSKKRSLEVLSDLLAGAVPDYTQAEIFDSLVARERLGSTGLGNGVALPHGRLRSLKQPIAALLTLRQGIDFDAIDRKPVDLLYALLVPESSDEEHLKILAQLAALFSNPEFCSRLRDCGSSEQCLELIHNQSSDQQLTA